MIVVGDGKSEPQHFSGDKLSNYEELLDAGKQLTTPHAAETSQHRLTDRLFE